MKKVFVLFVLLGLLFGIHSQNLINYKLRNGLTVYLWPDENQPNVTGVVAVRTGSIDEPLEYTGLAHYLEHVLFKGTQKIGSFDWEKEEPLYNDIIRLYDESATTTDPAKRAELEKTINEKSIEAAQYSFTNEFSNLVQGMGGEGMNAGTTYDFTYYYNDFPAFQVEKWLDLYSERFINPVFRSFQAELENVFEEYNMYQDNNNTHIRNFLFSNLYKGHPYERDVIGVPDHLKNPRLSKLIEFYNIWYVPNNMALILVGNFDVNTVKPLIESKFSRLKTAELPERPTYSDVDFSTNPTFSARLGYSPAIFWGYKGVPTGHKDETALDFAINLLSNSMNTGLLDKITLDGEVQYAGASLDSRRDGGRILVQAIPYYDTNQRRYDSNRATERIVIAEVDKIKNGNIEDWLIESVRSSLLRQYELTLENSQNKMYMLLQTFVYQLPSDYYQKAIEEVKTISKADIQQITKKYLSGGHITVSIEEGAPKKNKLQKPSIKPIEQPKGKTSEYAQYLKSIRVNEVKEVFNDFSDVKVVELYDKIKLHYGKNPANDYFTLTLRYGVGTEKMPKLEYAASLMNSAGIMPNSDAQQVRRQFSELNATCTYRVTDSYFYITLVGLEDNLKDICRLMTRQILMPKLDDKQLERVVGRELSTRLLLEKKNAEILGDALLDYALYQKESDYIDRLDLMGVYNLKISELTGEIIRATNYELDAHYVGKKSLDEVVSTLKGNLPLKEGVLKSESPFVKPRVEQNTPKIYFLPNSDAQQAQIYFYFEGENYTIEDDVNYLAFQQYFSGSFNGLVIQEIRESNSMAYSAGATFRTPPVQNKNTYFLGFVGTQPDKAADATGIFMDLLNNMPLYPERIDNIKMYLKQTSLSNKPSFRSKSQTFDYWQKLGYKDDPAKLYLPKIEALTFSDIELFYNKHVKNKPVTIVIMGDPKLIDMKKIQTNHGKVTKLSTNSLFSSDKL